MNLKLPELILYTTKSPSRYTETNAEVFKIVENGSGNESKQVIDNIKKIIKDKRISPSQKVLALDLFHACMQAKRPDFVRISETRMIRLFSRLAQKTSLTLFSDSPDTYDNRLCSERFLANLLKYLYIWANDSDIANGKKTSEYTKAFYKLRDIVNFTPVKIARGGTTKKSEGIKEDKGYLKQILSTLEILEEIENPERNEIGKELIKSLGEYLPGLEKTLQLAKNQGREEVESKIEKVLKRILKFTSLELKATPIKEPVTLKSPRSILEDPRSPLDLNSPIYTDLEKCDLRLENSNLRQIIREKEEIIKNISQTVQSLHAKIKVLEENYKKIKDLLYSKEQECAECHVVKESLRNSCIIQPNNYNELAAFAQKNFNTTQNSLPQFFNTMSCPPSSNPRDEGTEPESEKFRLCCCGKSEVLLENNFVKVTFEGKIEESAYELVLKVQNISEFRLFNLETDFDRAFGFSFVQKQNMLVELGPNEISLQGFSVSQICVTHLVPTISLKFDLSDRFLEYIFQVPINIAAFSKPISQNYSQLWSEFELLAFDSESKSCKCEFSLRRCRKLIKLSPNTQIFYSKNLSSLNNCQLLAIFSLSSLCFVLITLDTLGKMAHIELRSDSQALRKTLFTLIITQITT